MLYSGNVIRLNWTKLKQAGLLSFVYFIAIGVSLILSPVQHATVATSPYSNSIKQNTSGSPFKTPHPVSIQLKEAEGQEVELDRGSVDDLADSANCFLEINHLKPDGLLISKWLIPYRSQSILPSKPKSYLLYRHLKLDC